MTLQAAREAFAAHQWDRAFELLGAADGAEPLGAEDLERLAEAARWSRRFPEMLDTLERAQDAFARAGERCRDHRRRAHHAQAIDDDQARAEGFAGRTDFLRYWQKLHKLTTWPLLPRVLHTEVWAITFRLYVPPPKVRRQRPVYLTPANRPGGRGDYTSDPSRALRTNEPEPEVVDPDVVDRYVTEANRRMGVLRAEQDAHARARRLAIIARNAALAAARNGIDVTEELAEAEAALAALERKASQRKAA